MQDQHSPYHPVTAHRGQRPKALRDAVGGDLRRAKQSGDAAERHLYKLEQSAFSLFPLPIY